MEGRCDYFLLRRTEKNSEVFPDAGRLLAPRAPSSFFRLSRVPLGTRRAARGQRSVLLLPPFSRGSQNFSSQIDPKISLFSFPFPSPPPISPGPFVAPHAPFPLLIPPPSVLWAWEKPYARSPGGRSPFPPPPPSPRQETLMLQGPPPSSLFSATVRPRPRPSVYSPPPARALVYRRCHVLAFPSLSTPTTRREVRPIAELPHPVRPRLPAPRAGARACSKIPPVGSAFTWKAARAPTASVAVSEPGGCRRPPESRFRGPEKSGACVERGEEIRIGD